MIPLGPRGPLWCRVAPEPADESGAGPITASQLRTRSRSCGNDVAGALPCRCMLYSARSTSPFCPPRKTHGRV